jgi:hypothetical protein
MDRLVRGGAGSARTEGMWSFANSAFHQTIMLITAIHTSIGRLRLRRKVWRRKAQIRRDGEA